MDVRNTVAVCPLLGEVAMNISIIGVSGDLGLGITFLVLGSMTKSNRSNTICPISGCVPSSSAKTSKTAFLPAISNIIYP